MLDLRRIRTEPDAVKAELARRGLDGSDIDRVVELDRQHRAALAESEAMRAEVKELSRQVGQLHREGKKDEAQALQDESRRRGEDEKARSAEATALAAQIREILLLVPNTPSPDAPDGTSDADNPVLRRQGDPEDFEEHQRIPHWELGERYGILDNERAVKLSGAMFTMQRKGGATLARALCQYALDRNADAYEEVRPPSLVLTATLTATGQLPKFAEDAYSVPADDLWAIPTAEAPLTSIHRDEVVPEAELPLRLMAYSPCYRREAGSAGRDTRGMLRTHEFDKVELFAYATPEQAPDELQQMVARVESMIDALGLVRRTIEICTGDMGQSHHRSFDIEVWSPGTGQWLEVSSVSWLSDYQARRANIRSKPADGPARMIHTLNGSALAVPRVWAAIVETYHRADGGIDVPDVLLPYFRGADRIA